MAKAITIIATVFVTIMFLFSHTVVEANWTVVREDDIIRADGIEGMLQDVYFMDNLNGLVVGNNGLMLETADGGKTWKKKEVNMRPPGAGTGQRPGGGGPPAGFGGGGSVTLYNIYFVNEKVGFITGARGTILKTEDSGKTWNRKIARSGAAEQNTNRRRGGIRANLMGIQMVSETVGFIAGSENTILKTTDGGETWIGSSERARVGETRNNLENILFVSPTTGWVIGSYGTLLHTTDGGETWEKRNAGVDHNLFGIHFFNDKIGWICGQEGLILYTNDSGKTWNQQKTDSFDNLYDIVFVDEMVGWTAGDYGAVLHTTDGGKTWNASKVGSSGAIKGIHATDKDHCWTVDDWGVIATYKK
ncbi:MAG: YCF48-related protein [Candidatus Poribacteria bacterium]|nr:YCF48-related protein [Candidatus Poribacteria bacterium]